MDFKGSVGGFSEEPDKIDMSLDDIIRLNRKQKQTSKKGTAKRKIPTKGRLSQGRRTGSLPVGPTQRGGVAKFGMRGHRVTQPVKRRRGQGVITGLAARKSASLFKGISPLNRPVADQLPQKSRPFGYDGQRRRMQNIQRRPYRQTDAPKPQHALTRRPIQLRRSAPPIHQAQREARQATFLHRRGLKVQASVQKTSSAPVVHRTRPWRTSTTNSGILTVCIDNPSARTQPEPARAWSLHPQSSPTPVKAEKEPERKPPKGVPLQFDINSVGKQTAMTLNERFRILKERRTAAAAQSTKGSRFVTVG